MNEDARRGFLRAFCEALMMREPQRLAPYLAADIDWLVFGPIDLFPYFGRRRDANAVLKMVGEFSDALELRDCQVENTLDAPSQSAMLVRLAAVHRKSGRQVSLRLAIFTTFEGDKLVALRAILDSLDAAEQVLGRMIDLSGVA